MSEQDKPVNDNAPLTPDQAAVLLHAIADAFTPKKAAPAPQEPPAKPTKRPASIARVNFTPDELDHLKHGITIAAALNDDGMLNLQDGDYDDPGEEFFWCVKIICHALARITASQTIVEYTGA